MRDPRPTARRSATSLGERLALLVVGEDLQLDGQVDLAHVDPVGRPISTVGAKFRMLVTPAATIRSQTSCAAAAGVAITPMATPCSRTIASRSSNGADRRGRRRPRRAAAGSASSRATTGSRGVRKPE